MRVGLVVGAFNRATQEACLRAEALGYDGVWLAPSDSDMVVPALVFASALAGRTRSLTVGIVVEQLTPGPSNARAIGLATDLFGDRVVAFERLESVGREVSLRRPWDDPGILAMRLRVVASSAPGSWLLLSFAASLTQPGGVDLAERFAVEVLPLLRPMPLAPSTWA